MDANPWVRYTVTALLALASAFTLAFSSFTLYFGESLFSFVSFRTLLGIFSPIAINFALVAFVITMILNLIIFQAYLLSATADLSENLERGIPVEFSKTRKMARFFSYFNSFGLFGRDQALGNVPNLIKDNKAALTRYSYIISIAFSAFYFIGFNNSLNMIIYIANIFFFVSIVYVANSISMSLRNDQNPFKFKNVSKYSFFLFHTSFLTVYFGIVAFSFGYLRADYLARSQPVSTIYIEDKSVSMRIIGYTNDGVVVYSEDRFEYLPLERIKSISFDRDQNRLDRLLILGR